MTPTWVAISSLIITGVLAGKQLLDWLKQRRRDRTREAAEQEKAPAERDSIIVGGAETAVTVLRQTLAEVHTELERERKYSASLRKQLDERDRKIAGLEERLRTAEGELRTVADELAAMKEH